MVNKSCVKLSGRFLDLQEFEENWGGCLQELPNGVKVHSVFHISHLKKHIGKETAQFNCPCLMMMDY